MNPAWKSRGQFWASRSVKCSHVCLTTVVPLAIWGECCLRLGQPVVTREGGVIVGKRLFLVIDQEVWGFLVCLLSWKSFMCSLAASVHLGEFQVRVVGSGTVPCCGHLGLAPSTWDEPQVRLDGPCLQPSTAQGCFPAVQRFGHTGSGCSETLPFLVPALRVSQLLLFLSSSACGRSSHWRNGRSSSRCPHGSWCLGPPPPQTWGV